MNLKSLIPKTSYKNFIYLSIQSSLFTNQPGNQSSDNLRQSILLVFA
jgi:hypothetical protein